MMMLVAGILFVLSKVGCISQLHAGHRQAGMDISASGLSSGRHIVHHSHVHTLPYCQASSTGCKRPSEINWALQALGQGMPGAPC